MGRSPHTPGGTPLLSRPSPSGPPPFTPPRTKRAPLEGEFEPLKLRKYQLTSMGSRSMDSSPQSRPRSPWGNFDPYDSAEDMDREYVGFATLPNQVHRKSVKKGFAFTLMVAGESGLGKSTLVNSLYLTDLYNNRKVLNAEERIVQTVFITKHTVGIEEKGVRLRLSIVDTPGFGDAVNNTERYMGYLGWNYDYLMMICCYHSPSWNDDSVATPLYWGHRYDLRASRKAVGVMSLLCSSVCVW
ncbi:unnamed protein product [Oncorhynchus mykiss]|uniref:Septin-type G domain-containing protein n=1 Tax=Oncorhynchus mykiss TaxID=8022 RepID=A0A060VQQ2_ONCMY|nr:unnamed protein product [Oncorhynchus mykiss]